MSFYSNYPAEELDNYLSFLGQVKADSVDSAKIVFLDMEQYLFRDYPDFNFANHKFSSKELINRLDQLIKMISDDGKEREVYLFVNMVDVKSSSSEELFWWSYYNHKFTDSKGKDSDAMNKWHELESSLGINEVASFKARREANLALYLELIKKHLCFTEVIFAAIDEEQKRKFEFGLDIAEESYLVKMINEHQAQQVCYLTEKYNASLLVNFVRIMLPKLKFSASKTHIISNSKRLDNNLVESYKKLFLYMDIQETELGLADFIILFNDLDLLSDLPFINTEKPILVVDLSAVSSPNFAYILLKDEGFEQIYSYVKTRQNEVQIFTLLRGLSQGLLSLSQGRPFAEQIAINYMDDYFRPLARSHGKSLKDFSGPINLLVEKLEFEMEGENEVTINDDA